MLKVVAFGFKLFGLCFLIFFLFFIWDKNVVVFRLLVLMFVKKNTNVVYVMVIYLFWFFFSLFSHKCHLVMFS